MTQPPTHIVFSGGGTGGHLFPGLAVAERLVAKAPRVRVTFCGSGKQFERNHVVRAGFDYFTLPARPLPQGARDVPAFVIENLTSYLAAGRFLREENVAAVVGTGGYASVPMARAAVRHDVPLALLEQNAIPGKATRWLARHAALVCASFDETGRRLRSHCPVRLTGNPVRIRGEGRGERGEGEGVRDIHHPSFIIHHSANPPSPAPRLLVLGGSGGARTLNENVPRALYKIRGQLTGWQIVHQSGDADLRATRSLYAKLNLAAAVVPFIDDVPSMLAQTDLAVSRAGGTTLAELATAAVPAVLVPYPHAADDHQSANARHYTAGGGCVTIDQRDVSDRLDDRLGDALFFLLIHEKHRKSMSAAMRRMALPRAADEVAELIWSIATSRAARAAA